MRSALAAAAACVALLATGVAPASAADAGYAYSTESLGAPITDAPPNPRGTVMLVHAGGWAGPDHYKQRELFDRVAPTFLGRGYRVVSIDYAAGTAGRQSVQDAIGQEIVNHPTSGPLCLYGESAGGHLALLAAGAIGRVDCVTTYGSPTDFETFAQTAQAQKTSKPGLLTVLHGIIEKVFGTDRQQWSSWAPLAIADRIRADVAMMINADDPIVSLDQMEVFRRQSPTTETFVPEPAPNPTAADVWVHGSTTDAGRQEIRRRLAAHVDRAAKHREAVTAARRTGCTGVNTDAAISPARFRRAVACVVDRHARRGTATRRLAAVSSMTAGRRLTLSVGGKITAARVAEAILSRASARRLVASPRMSRVALAVTIGAPSRVVLRVR